MVLFGFDGVSAMWLSVARKAPRRVLADTKLEYKDKWDICLEITEGIYRKHLNQFMPSCLNADTRS
jgi:hypothetical protein